MVPSTVVLMVPSAQVHIRILSAAPFAAAAGAGFDSGICIVSVPDVGSSLPNSDVLIYSDHLPCAYRCWIKPMTPPLPRPAIRPQLAKLIADVQGCMG
jgi:hypothetical protein